MFPSKHTCIHPSCLVPKDVIIKLFFQCKKSGHAIKVETEQYRVASCRYLLHSTKAKGVYRNMSKGGRGQNLNCKFKTFGFLDTLNVHIQSNYLTSTTLSLIQTKLAGKNCKLIFYVLHSSVSNFKSVIALRKSEFLLYCA